MSNEFGIDRESSVKLIVQTALENGVTDPKQISYMLATAEHESQNFTRAEEIAGRSQALKLGYSGGEEYFGRGYVQITHDYNYQQFDKALNLNGELEKNPNLAEDPKIAAKILVIGMRDGMFTGKRLDNYVDNDTQDLYNARRTVNGVTSRIPESIEAANDCKNKAEAWEKQVSALIEDVKKNGVELHEVEKTHGTQAHTSGVFKLGTHGAAVTALQADLAALGYTDNRGQVLQPDGNYGRITEAAVKAFQGDHGLPVDGIAGKHTLEAIQSQHQLLNGIPALSPELGGFTPPRVDGYDPANRAPAGLDPRAPGLPEAVAPASLRDFSDPNHPQNALYNTLKEGFPPETPPELLTQATAACYMSGIKQPDDLGHVVSNNGNIVFMTHSMYADNAKLDSNQPAPSVQQTMQNVQQFDQHKLQAHAEFQAQNAQINAQAPQGPVLGGPPTPGGPVIG